MLDRRHVNQKSSWQCDMRRDTRAFSCDRFLRYLYEDLLPLAKQIGNGRLRRTIASIATVAAPIAAAVIASAARPAFASAATWTSVAAVGPDLNRRLDQSNLGRLHRRLRLNKLSL